VGGLGEHPLVEAVEHAALHLTEIDDPRQREAGSRSSG